MQPVSNIIQLSDYIQIKPAARVTLDQTYVCPRCDACLTTRKLWVDALINCRCGTRMEAK